MSPPPLTGVPAGATSDGGTVALPDAVGVPSPATGGGASPVERLLQGGRLRALFTMLGPAFVAAVAYVDPGNFATNIQGGARFGYALLWVVVLANAMAMLIQYLSAKLGIATGRSLPQLARERLPRGLRWGLWIQAEVMAMATDIAEFLGAALGLNLLFGVPLFTAGLITGVIAFGILELQRHGVRRFELAIASLLAIVFAGFLYETLRIGPSAHASLAGLIPSVHGTSYLYLAVGIIGATVMPHAIYLHSALTNGRMPARNDKERRVVLGYERIDVIIALGLAGVINVTMLIVAANASTFVASRLTWTPITSRRLVNTTRGTRAKGIPNDNTTWLRTSALVGLTPSARITSAGIIVIARRTRSGTRMLMKPAITTCPA